MTTSKLNVIIVIPAFNEAAVIGPVIRSIISTGYPIVIVVNDGSTDNTGVVAQQSGAMVIQHQINRGKGAATKTGIEAAKLSNADIVVTMDGDGQHFSSDINKLIQPLVDSLCDVSLGTRHHSTNHIPTAKIIANQIANLITWIFFGLWVKDSQSGFRAYNQLALNCISTSGDAYEYESEVIREIKRHRLVYKEVPINVHYSDYSMSKEVRQNSFNGLKTFYKLIWKVISF